jgi:hypothetical protein
MGFIPGALVSVTPESGGLAINLCNDNITKYNELSNRVKEKGGKLITVGTPNQYKPHGYLTVILGKNLKIDGYRTGDTVVVLYDYGIIRVHKLPAGKYFLVGKNRDNIGRPVPHIVIWGHWLTDAGFTQDAFVTADSKPGCVTYTVWKDNDYCEMVKFARKYKMKTINVRSRNVNPLISLRGAMLDNAGFDIGDIFSVEHEHGVIQLQKLNLGGLPSLAGVCV